MSGSHSRLLINNNAASKQHVLQMLQAGDAAHKQAMDEMMQLSQADQEKWYGEFVAGFAALPDA